MKKIYLVLAILLTLAGRTFAQVTISSLSSCTAYTLTATISGITPVNSGLYSDDSYSGVIPIGFTFNYYGTPHTQLVIGENGQLTFDPTLAGGYDPYAISGALLGNSSAYNTVCAPWCDIETDVTLDPITYSTQGVAPNRTFAATWCRDHMFSCTAQYTTTQIIIYESTGVIEAHIGHKTSCAWNGGYAIVGVQNASGSAATVAPGRDYPTVWTTTGEAWRFTPAGTTSYTVGSIPYAPIPYASSIVYWYNASTGAYLGSGATVVVSPTVTTTYEAAGVGCDDTTKAFITLGPISGGATGTITGPSSVCLGGTLSLTDATPGGVWSSGSPAVATVNTTGLVTSVSGGTAVISYTNGPCTSTHIVTVNIAPPITGGTTLCVGGTSTLADAVTGGTWTSSVPGVATVGAATGLVTGVSSGTSTITYVTPAGCMTTTVVNIVVLAPISGTRTVCMGSTTSLSDPGAGGGAWTSSATGVATIGGGTGIVTGVSGGTSNITYTAAGGCYVSAVVTVQPTSPITGVTAMCQNFTTTLGDAIPGGSWTSASPAVATVNSSTGVVTGVSGGTATIIYTLPTGCAVNTVVTVHAKPAPPIPAAPFIYCQFAASSAVSAAGTGLLWYGPGVTGGMATGPVPNTSIAGSITYYVTQTSSFGCVSDSATDVITITPQPSAPITHDTAYCQFYNGFVLPLNYEVDSVSGSSLKWYSVAGSPLSGAPTPVTAVADYPGGTTWNVSQIVNGCESPQASIKVTIIPTPKFDLVYRNWVCQDDSIMMSFSLTGGSVLVDPVYTWQLPEGATATDGTTVTSASVYVKFDSANVTYSVGYLTVGNLNGECSTQDTFTVRVVPAPYAQGFTKQDVCQGDTVNLALSSQAPNAANFFWQIDGITMTSSGALNIVSSNSDSGGPFSISWNTPGLHVISVQTNTTEGCMDKPENDTVNVHALPDPTFVILPSKTGTLCLEDSILFKANLVDANVSYLWQPEHNFNNNNHAEVWGRVEQGRTDIILTVTDPFGCKASSDKQLSPDACCTVLFPSAFSPNGDGLNDNFRPIFNGYHNFHEFRVVNRWGQTVFESANSNPSWDGSFNGVPQDMGVYYYFIKYDCGGNTIEERGDCTLVR